MTETTKTNSVRNGGAHTEKHQEQQSKPQENSLATKREASWPSVLFLIHIHALGGYGLYAALAEAKLLTVLFMLLLVALAILGTTAGVHRLWTHRTYSAALPLKIFLMLCYTLVGQGTIYDWILYHRLHHKTFNTPDDPYFSTTGFLDAQFRAQYLSLSPKQEKLLQEIGMEDVKKDKVVMFQKNFYWVLYIVLFVLLPINAPAEYWGESIVNSFFVLGVLRYALVLHAAWLVNSAVHVWGLKRGEKYPDESNMVFLLTKSYWNLYHYMLPWDYQSGEYGTYASGATTALIRMWASLGWATHLRTMDSESVRKALIMAVDTGRPVDECMNEVGEDALLFLHPEHYIDYTKHQ